MKYRFGQYLVALWVLCLGVVALPTPVLAQSYVTITVQPGDSLGKIAGRYCTNWQMVYDINRQTIGANPSAIEVGMVLTVPNNCGGSPVQLPETGGNGIYDRGPTTHASGTFNSPYYTVAWGDTLYSVSNRFGLSQDALLRANNIYQGGLLTGQTLLIPGLNSGGGSQPQPPKPQPPAVNAERVYFSSGNIAASRVGTIVNGAAKRYVLGGRARQVMEIHTRSHGEALTVAVMPVNGGALVVNGQNSGLENNLWVDLPSSGDYIVTITPVRLPESPQLNFDIFFIIQ
ncbi:MAG: LysM peptidoglycan-binding domain-containing protein [Caldilineaceae bacterium]